MNQLLYSIKPCQYKIIETQKPLSEQLYSYKITYNKFNVSYELVF